MTLGNYPIYFNRINISPWKDKGESFENLWKEFFIKEYWIQEPVDLINWFPGIESPPVLWSDWKYYWFQSKLITSSLRKALNDSFISGDWTCKIWLANLKKMDFLVIISNKDLPIREVFFNKLLSDIKLRIEAAKHWIEVIYIVWEVFRGKLKSPAYPRIRQKYFYSADVQEELHQSSRWEALTIWEIEENYWRWSVELWFSWKYLKKDLDLAWQYQEAFLLNKYMYFDSYSFDVFTQLESTIPSRTFPSIALHTQGITKKNLEEVLEYASWVIAWAEEDVKYFIPDPIHKKGLFANYGSEELLAFDYEETEVVKFIDKHQNNE